MVDRQNLNLVVSPRFKNTFNFLHSVLAHLQKFASIPDGGIRKNLSKFDHLNRLCSVIPIEVVRCGYLFELLLIVIQKALRRQRKSACRVCVKKLPDIVSSEPIKGFRHLCGVEQSRMQQG